MSAEWGTRVVATEKAVRAGITERGGHGIVVHSAGLQLWVVKYGERTVRTYHRDLWEPSRG